MKDNSKTNYEKLAQIIPDMERHLLEENLNGKSKQKPPFMDLNVDYLSKEGNNRHLVALSHNYEMNGDLVPDPDMMILLDTLAKTADAKSYQNILLYQEVGKEDTPANRKLQKELNEFLSEWLSNAIVQGHKIKIGHERSSEQSREDELGDARRKDGNEPGIER